MSPKIIISTWPSEVLIVPGTPEDKVIVPSGAITVLPGMPMVVPTGVVTVPVPPKGKVIVPLFWLSTEPLGISTMVPPGNVIMPVASGNVIVPSGAIVAPLGNSIVPPGSVIANPD